MRVSVFVKAFSVAALCGIPAVAQFSVPDEITMIQEMTALLQGVTWTEESSWSSGSWTVSGRTILSRNAQGHISEVLDQILEGTVYIDESRSVLTSNTAGNITSLTTHSRQNGVWTPEMMIAFTYNADGTMGSLAISMPDSTGAFQRFLSQAFVYDAAKNITLSRDTVSLSELMSYAGQTDYTYTGGKLTRKETKISMGLVTMPISRTDIIYPSTVTSVSTNSTYDVQTQTWTAQNRTTKTRNAAGNVTEIMNEGIDENDENGGLINNNRTLYSYEGGRIAETVDQIWEETQWVNETRSVSKTTAAPLGIAQGAVRRSLRSAATSAVKTYDLSGRVISGSNRAQIGITAINGIHRAVINIR